MATQSSKGSKSRTQAKRATTETRKSAQKTATAGKRAATKTAAAQKSQVQSAVEAAVDLPVGAVLRVGDRFSDLVEPWTGRSKAERQIRSYRTQVRKTLKRTERRGATARRRATTEARRRQRTVETTLKRNRSEVEKRVRRAIEEQSNRAQGLVDQVAGQLSSLR